MRIYCLKLSSQRKDAGDDVFLYYTPMSYLDWRTYGNPSVRYDPPTVRYLFELYLKEMTVGTEKVDPVEFRSYPVAHQKLLIDNMFEKSSFGDTDKFIKMVESAKSDSLTLPGCYDYFLFTNLGIESYISLLEQDADVRAHIISMMEQQTGISVKKRFETAVSLNIPVNLRASNEEYNKILQRYKKTGALSHTLPQVSDGFTDKLTGDMSVMVAESRAALAEKLDARNNNLKRPAFNWERDESNFSHSVDQD